MSPTLGALRGSLTFSRFFVVGDLPKKDLSGFVLKRVHGCAFQPLVPEEDATERFGWANVADPFDTELDHGKIFFNEFVVLGLRLDRWVVPGPLLKSHLRKGEEALKKRKGTDKLGRKAKADLKMLVLKKLRKQLVPASRTTDLVWHLPSGVVQFHSHSKKSHELVQALFEKTFKVQLLLESPGTAADRRGLTKAEQKAFDGLEPTLLVDAQQSA